MNTTSFISSNQWLGSIDTPTDINDRAANLLRRKRMNVCLHCGEAHSRILPDRPLFSDGAWDIHFSPCPSHGGKWVFFSDSELQHLLEFLPQSILSAELIARSHADACAVAGTGV